MTYNYTGSVRFSSGRQNRTLFELLADVKEIFAKGGFEDEVADYGSFFFEEYNGGINMEISDCVGGDWEDQFRKCFSEMYAAGILCVGHILYTGDYCGAYQIIHERFSSFDEEEWTIHRAPTEKLLTELKRRGYSLSQ